MGLLDIFAKKKKPQDESNTPVNSDYPEYVCNIHLTPCKIQTTTEFRRRKLIEELSERYGVTESDSEEELLSI